jgi:hypothetical protein
MRRRPARNAAQRETPRLSDDLADFLRTLARSMLDSYRPELHYMRGPGPKWHAKHASAAQTLEDGPALAGLRIGA